MNQQKLDQLKALEVTLKEQGIEAWEIQAYFGAKDVLSFAEDQKECFMEDNGLEVLEDLDKLDHIQSNFETLLECGIQDDEGRREDFLSDYKATGQVLVAMGEMNQEVLNGFEEE